MYVNVINGGDQAMAALIYRQPNQQLMEYLTNNLNTVINTASHYSSAFVNTVQDMYNRFNSEASRLYNKLMLANGNRHMNQDQICYLSSEQLPDANLVMQRYILAQPDIQKMYNRNMCYGYQDTYISHELDTKPKDSVEYDRVMSGVMQYDEEDEDGYVLTISRDDELWYKDELEPIDQLNVLYTWDQVMKSIADHKDPTDPYANIFK